MWVAGAALSCGAYLLFWHFDALQNLMSFALEAPLAPQVPAGHVTPVKRLALMPAALISPVLMSMSGIAATVATTKIFSISRSLLNDVSRRKYLLIFQTRPLPKSKQATRGRPVRKI
jgi:hypothetical protein